MHKKPPSKIEISKEKLTKHFEKHFSERELELPPELIHPENFEYLRDTPFIINEETHYERDRGGCKNFQK
jgi:hypothetical protein